MSATQLSSLEKEDMIRQCAPLVRRLAARMAKNLPTFVEKQDLVNDGMLGLMDALGRFDPSKGIKFQTFAACRIRGSILDGLRSSDWVSRGARRRARQVQVAHEELTQLLGKSPSVKEVALYTGLTPDEVFRRRQETALGFVSSLDQARGASEEGDETVADTVCDATPSVLEQAHRKSQRGAIRAALQRLAERDRLILSLYYFEELTIRQIGELLGVSEARISQLHSRIMKKLRENLGNNVLDLVS